MNWKESVNNQSWSVGYNIPTFIPKDWAKPRNPYKGDRHSN